MVGLSVPLRPHCSPALPQSYYFTSYDYVDVVENPASHQSGQPQFLAPSVQQQPDFELFPPSGYSACYSPCYTPDYGISPSYPSPALTNNPSFSASPYQPLEGEFSMPAPLGLGVKGASLASPVSFASSPIPFTPGLPSPSPLQPPRQMPPPASASTTKYVLLVVSGFYE